MFKTFSLVQIHSEGSDCTAPYRLSVIGTPSVGEVINDILSSDDWGTIAVFSEGRNSIVSHASYKHGQIEGTRNLGYDGHIVIGGRSVGGWSNMEYTLYIK